MKKSTLTVVVAFVFAIIAACIAFPKLADSKPKSSVGFNKMEVKTGHHSRPAVDIEDEKNIPVQFGLSANFGPKPE